jgi:hypothetical protein
MVEIEIIGYAALIAVGMILGIAGSGGAMLSVPILVYLFALDVVVASAYSFFIVGATSTVGAILKQKQQLMDIRAASIFGIPSVITIFIIRKWVIYNIPEYIIQTDFLIVPKRTALLGLFAGLVLLSAVLLIRGRNVRPNRKNTSDVTLTLAGFSTGILAGLTGIGGGFLILPALLLFTHLSFKTAVATTLCIIGANSIFGFLGSAFDLPINWFFLSVITTLSITGILIGHFFQARFQPHILQKALGWFTLLIGALILWQEMTSAA